MFRWGKHKYLITNYLLARVQLRLLHPIRQKRKNAAKTKLAVRDGDNSLVGFYEYTYPASKTVLDRFRRMTMRKGNKGKKEAKA
jgi:hypothetical protein